MDTSKPNISIIADYRERASQVPCKLEEQGVNLSMQTLKVGDYLINNEIIIERKTKNDFVTSLMQGRLFLQCSKLVKTYVYSTTFN